MNLQLAGKQALVTGSTAGIGFATAQRLAEEGAAVVLNGRTPEHVDQAVQRLRTRRPPPRSRGWRRICPPLRAANS